MAQLVLSTVGQAIGSQWGPIFSVIGQAAGAYAGAAIDRQLFGTTQRYEGARLSDLHLQGSTEGASVPAVFGRVRIAGQVIWAARFKEHVETRDVGGGKGGPRAKSTNYRYTLSFAVGLCEGEIGRIARVWSNGEALDTSGVTMRVYAGREDQPVDALIEAIEGVGNAPAYRGLAYVVFEDLPLERFGNVMPQLSFEVVRPAPSADEEARFEQRVKGVCLIPGAGEFVYATEPVLRTIGPGAQAPENVHAERERANLLVSLDQLAADFPSCETVMLVVSWFGNDLRCGECWIKPGVEIAAKETTPLVWRAGGVTRSGAHLISTFEGAPAFGGTPSDDSVLQAITELKARGYRVGLYPFVLMDVPAENALPDPYGGAAQAAYPWRGRVTIHPAAGQDGSPDKTSAAAAQVAAFFGEAALEDFGATDGAPSYVGPDEWSYRRFVLHYAKLAALAGGVDAFVLGSELRGLTTARDDVASYPAVAALRALAADVRAMVGGETTLTYAADWSEYFGHQPQDGSADVFFHLDALWADENIDVVGVDWYAPLTDWRAGATHLDAELARNIHDPAYLASRIEAGETYDWFYASDEDRAAQARTPISDGAYGEPWIYRAKDLRNFWARAHYDRPGGVRSEEPTAWAPQSKPIWLIELGCSAVDKGANAPNLFTDAKSDESALAPFSTGARDDLIQQRVLDAYLRYWDRDAQTNPVSTVDGKPMIEEIMVWAWDARPHPAFPARSDVWADGAAWRLGHWLNGRAGLSGLGEVVQAICARAGVGDVDVSQLFGTVSGYVVDSPADARGALEPLMAAYGFDAVEREGRVCFVHHAKAVTELTPDEFAAESVGAAFAQRADAAEAPVEARVRFLDAAKDYLIASVSARRRDNAEGGVASIDAPLVLEPDVAEAIAERVLAEKRAATETLNIALGPAHMALEPGDAVRFAGGADAFEIVRIEDAETRRLELRRRRGSAGSALGLADPSAPPSPLIAPTPALAVLDLPPLPGAESDERPLAAVFASPWFGTHEVHAGSTLSRRAVCESPAVMGELLWALWPGPVDRWDDGNVVRIKLYGGALANASREAVLDGANAFAIEADGEWELVQARSCVLVGPNEYELSGFLRGRLGSAHAMRAPHPVGARIVALNERLARVEIGAHEWGEALAFAAPPAGRLASDPRALQVTATLPRAAGRPWAPAHLRARQTSDGDIVVSWVRCARIGGDGWGASEPPLGASAESYRLEVLSGDDLVRTEIVVAASFTYTEAAQAADFALPPGSLRFRVAQIGDGGATGLNSELTITL